MTAEEMRKWAGSIADLLEDGKERTDAHKSNILAALSAKALCEIAAQLAELNAKLSDVVCPDSYDGLGFIRTKEQS